MLLHVSNIDPSSTSITSYRSYNLSGTFTSSLIFSIIGLWDGGYFPDTLRIDLEPTYAFKSILG